VVKRRGHQLLLVAHFLAVIYAVGLLQAVKEVRQGERPQVLDLFHQRPTASNLRAFEKDLEAQSCVAQVLRPWMQYARFLAFKDAGEKALIGRSGWWFYRPDVRYLVEPCPTSSKDKTGYGEVVSAIISFRDQLAARDIRLLVVPVPGKPSVYSEMVSARAFPVDPRVHAHTRRLIGDLTGVGVEVVDLFDAFARARAGESRSHAGRYYLIRDTHWSGDGARLAAEAVARRVRELGWATTSSTVYDLKPVRVSRPGDILRMLRAQQIEQLFEPQEVECGQVIRRDNGQPYRDDPSASILVLGDSFLRIYERDEPGSAGFIAHLARQLGQPIASIVSDGGASTLVRQELARKPALLVGKQLVVWEFVERDIRFGMEGWQQVPIP